MNKLFINLHPEYDYATVVVQGYYPILKDYVKTVEWLTWSNPSRGHIMVLALSKDFEEKKKEHVDKTYIIAQRLLNLGVEVLIRNGRKDQWEPFISREYSEEFMYKTECESSEFKSEVKGIEANIAKYENTKEVDISDKEDLVKLMEKLTKLIKKEEIRKKYIHKLWNN